MYEIICSCTTDKGKRRRINQDNIVCDHTYLDHSDENNGYHKNIRISLKYPVIAGVFDGLGGEQCGEKASFIAAKEAAGLVFDHDITDILTDYVRKTNRKICDFAASNDIASMGTTAAVIVFDRKRLYVCNIGDSKIFLLNDGKMTQLSEDHVSSAPQGVKAPLTQCLGIPEEKLRLEPHIFNMRLTKESVFLICSDGLTDMVGIPEITDILTKETTENASGMLVKKALEHGGKDNVSVIVCRAARKKLFQKRVN